MLFKCRLCGSLADDGDIKDCVCLRCIDSGLYDEVKQQRLHPINRMENNFFCEFSFECYYCTDCTIEKGCTFNGDCSLCLYEFTDKCLYCRCRFLDVNTFRKRGKNKMNDHFYCDIFYDCNDFDCTDYCPVYGNCCDCYNKGSIFCKDCCYFEDNEKQDSE